MTSRTTQEFAAYDFEPSADGDHLLDRGDDGVRPLVLNVVGGVRHGDERGIGNVCGPDGLSVPLRRTERIDLPQNSSAMINAAR